MKVTFLLIQESLQDLHCSAELVELAEAVLVSSVLASEIFGELQ